MNKNKKIIIFILVSLQLFLLGFEITNNSYKHDETNTFLTEEFQNMLKNFGNLEESEITISAVGDIMFHLPMYKRSYNVETGEYNFDSYYRKMKKYFDRSDLVVGNYEATSLPEKPMSGFPFFNAPKESIRSLKEQGFDLLVTANNHCLDTGMSGLISTIDLMNEYGIYHTGTFSGELRDGLLINIKGIKVGVLSYTQEFNGLDSRLPKDKSYMANKLEIETVKLDVNELKSRGADIILLFPHWGQEYVTVPTNYQKEMTKLILDAGVDIILGSHPHVIQRGELIESLNSKKYVLYSLGNSISNQRYETMGNYNTECGILAEIKISKNFKNNKTTLKEVNLIPTYVNRVKNSKGYNELEVIAIDDILEGGEFAHIFDQNIKARVIKNRERIENILNSKN